MTVETFAWFVAGATVSGHLVASRPPGCRALMRTVPVDRAYDATGWGVRKE